MKIYFAGSIRGGRGDADLYLQIIGHLKRYGEVLTEHLGDKNLTSQGEILDNKEIHNRDLEWVLSSDIIVAEVTTPSLGAGYELGRAVENKKCILCLYRPKDGKRLSAMIAGCSSITTMEYSTIEDAKKLIDGFFCKK